MTGYTFTTPADPSPTRDGFVFSGWYEDSGFTGSWDFSADTVAGDMTLYALWLLALTLIVGG